ncbi:MAG TPA: metalloregulator ArsR/SmtB family transcription factor [Solirubrobacteraceae bacterium]|nr:metalloregulator ArsR/SmtB family transcription factor [Solirubrobacteraceae bacterium]
MAAGTLRAIDALAEPNRRQILDLLNLRARSVGELVEELRIGQPAVSKHLRVLRDAGLVDVRAEAQRRIYRVRADPLKELDEWLEPYRRQWAHALDALERELDGAAQATKNRELSA